MTSTEKETKQKRLMKHKLTLKHGQDYAFEFLSPTDIKRILFLF